PAAASAKAEPGRKISWLWPAVAALGFALAATVAMVHFREVPEKRTATRFEFGYPHGQLPPTSGGFSMSPDGDILLAATDDKGTHWFLRRMDSTEMRRLDLPAGSDPMPAAWSPD